MPSISFTFRSDIFCLFVFGSYFGSFSILQFVRIPFLHPPIPSHAHNHHKIRFVCTCIRQPFISFLNSKCECVCAYHKHFSVYLLYKYDRQSVCVWDGPDPNTLIIVFTIAYRKLAKENIPIFSFTNNNVVCAGNCRDLSHFCCLCETAGTFGWARKKNAKHIRRLENLCKRYQEVNKVVSSIWR